MKKPTFYLPVFLLALVLALCLVSPVSADDGSTGDTPVFAEVQPDGATEEETPVEPAVTPDVGSTAEAVTESAPVVTRDSGEITVAGDPYFTVGSTTYHFAMDCTGIDNCVTSPTPIEEAVNYMQANNLTPSDRKLYIEADDYTDNVVIDGTADGVKGLTGLVGLGDTPEDVHIDGTITVHDMAAGFSISNLTVENTDTVSDQIAISMYANTGTVMLTDVNASASSDDSAGIYIEQTGNVVLNRVNASNNAYIGAYIAASGSVTITNSAFDNNLLNTIDGNPGLEGGSVLRTGLYIFSPGTLAVTLNGVSASGNGGNGATINAGTSPVTIKNSAFNNNGSAYDEIGEYWYTVFDGWGDGLNLSGNVVTLSNVDLEFNGKRGLYNWSYSSFTGDRVIAANNLWTGIRIQNTGTGAATLKASAATNNSYDGIFIYSYGAVVLYDDYTGWNGENGLYIENHEGTTAVPVTLTLVTSENNGDTGVYIQTRGAVTGTNVRANNNVNGLTIEALGTGAVTFKIDASDPLVFNETSNNTGSGYTIISGAAVSLTSFDSYGNGGYGGTIDNTLSASAPVTLSVVNTKLTKSGISSNGGYGLQIYSNGLVTLKNLDASNNQLFGAYVYNIPAVGTGKPNVVISDSSFNDNCARDGEGNCYDDGNHNHNGLEVRSLGLISLTNITAAGNYGQGAALNNMNGITTAGVTINAGKNNGNSFLGNLGSGLYITTFGPVTLTNIAANNNSDYGAFILNNPGKGAVTLKQSGDWSDYYGNGWSGNSFDNNATVGLNIVSSGVVNVAFQEANWNGGTGIYINAFSGTGAVTLTGRYKQSQNATGNGGSGLKIDAQGNILLNNIEADNNNEYGADLNNASGTGLVTIKYGYFANNYSGIVALTTGAVNWSYGSADDNTNYGAILQNWTADLAAKPVMVSYVNTNRNGNSGLMIITKGAVTLTNVESNNNSINESDIEDGEYWTDNLTEDQVWYYTGEAGETLAITVNSENFNPCFSVVSASDGSFVGYACGTDGSAYAEMELPSNDFYNIYVWSEDGNNLHQYSIGAYNIATWSGTWTTQYSYAYGIFVDNSSGINAAVTVNNKSYNPWNSNNSATDLMVLSTGAVKVSNVTLNDSGNDGLFVSTVGAVTLTNVETSVNADNGAYISSTGAVTVKTASANSNNGGGYWFLTSGAVKLTDVGANDNHETGIFISTAAPVTFTSVFANNNAEYGARVLTSSTFTLNKSIYGANWFNGNGDDGLMVSAQGKVTITNTYAYNNGWWEYDEIADEWYPSTSANGINISNTNTSAPQPVVLTDVRASGNTLDGLRVSTSGAVTVSKVAASDNYHEGLSIDQSSAPTSAYAITISKITASNNGWHGIYVYGLGNITLSKFEANNNRGDSGVTLNNQSGTGTVTILNPAGGATNNFALFNAGNGVTVFSKGAVNITGLEVLGNGYDGLYVNNNSSSINAPVTLNTIITRGNNGNGIYVNSAGVVTVNNSWAVNNTYDGLNITTPGNTFIANTGSISNGWTGIYAHLDPSGNLTLTNCTWYGNMREFGYSSSNNLVFSGGSLVIH